MELIRTAGRIGQTVKNAQRLRQIVAVFARYGFVDVVDRIPPLGRLLPARIRAFTETQADKSIAERIRLAFEELGPTFVKFGQILSTRPDLLSEEFISEFTKLQDNVLPLPLATVRGLVESELGKKIEVLFDDFSETPLAAASIGQVHTATLKTGERVVIKIQRPEIGKLINQDISLMAFIAGLLEKYVPETRVIRPQTFVDEFFRTLNLEIDFVIEANNTRRIAENMTSFQEVVIPKVYGDYSTHKVLTLERLEGVRVNDLQAMSAAGIDRKAVVATGARAFFKSVFIDGIFHGDLHGGNLFVLPGNKLGIIDFGIVGRLSERSRGQLAAMVMALVTEDFENLCYIYADLGATDHAVDYEGFEREVRGTLAPYLGLALGEVNAGKVLIEATRIATKYNIKVPSDWMIVFKAILTMEGMGRTLDPHFDMLSMGRELIGDLVKNQYSMERITRDLTWLAKDTGALLRILPRQARSALKKWASNDFAFEIRSPQLDEMRQQVDINGRRQNLTFLAVGLVIAGTMSLQTEVGGKLGDYPIVSLFFYFSALLTLIRLFFRSFQ